VNTHIQRERLSLFSDKEVIERILNQTTDISEMENGKFYSLLLSAREKLLGGGHDEVSV
jgi:predicted nucleotidyltransferase